MIKSDDVEGKGNSCDKVVGMDNIYDEWEGKDNHKFIYQRI